MQTLNCAMQVQLLISTFAAEKKRKEENVFVLQKRSLDLREKLGVLNGLH